MSLSQAHLEWLDGRKISVEVAINMGCYSAKRGSTGVEPDPDGRILVFPYLENGGGNPERVRDNIQGRSTA